MRRINNNSAIIDIPTLNGAGTVELDVESGRTWTDVKMVLCEHEYKLTVISDPEDEHVALEMTNKEITTLVNDLIVRTNLQSQAHLCKESLEAGVEKQGEYKLEV